MPTQERDNMLEQEHLLGDDPIRLVSIGLDSKSMEGLRGFLQTLPMARLQAAIDSYPSGAGEWTKLTQQPAMDVCLIEFDRDRASATLTAEILHKRMPNTALFAVSSNTQPELIIQAMHCGCTEYLIKPLQHDQLLQAVTRIDGQKREKQSGGHVLVFLGAKGGVGTTTVVTHLGVLLARSGSRRTLLVDLHPSFGDADLYLGLTKSHKYSFRQLAESTDRLDTDLLQGFVLHHPSGLDLLPAPETSEPARPLSEGAIGLTLDFLRLRYEYVLIDCAPGLSEENQEAIQHSEGVYLITVSEVAALRNVVRYNDYFSKLKYSKQIRTVLNRYTKRGSITDEQIEKAIGQPIFWKIPNQYKQVIATNTEGDPSSRVSASEVARSVAKLAEQLVGQPAMAAAGRKGGEGLLELLGI